MTKRFALLLLLVLGTCPALHADDDTLRKARCYIEAYPDFFIGYEDGCLVTTDGRRIPFDDGNRSKGYTRMVSDHCVGDDAFDPEDALHWDYPARSEIPALDRPPAGDPGRIRPPEIFTYMYGATKSDRRRKMRPVHWAGSTVGHESSMLMTTVNGVDKALGAVSCEIENLPAAKKEDLEGIIFHVDAYSGYYDRPVRDYPQRTSAHAYGIAVDVNWNDSYFIGSHQGEPYRYRNNMPQFLVDIFERHGFIWGGRWRNYDTMHFEYRPELLLYHSR